MIYKAFGTGGKNFVGTEIFKKSFGKYCFVGSFGEFCKDKIVGKGGFETKTLAGNGGKNRGVGIRQNKSVGSEGGKGGGQTGYFLRNYRCFAVFMAAIFGAGAVIFGTVGFDKNAAKGNKLGGGRSGTPVFVYK